MFQFVCNERNGMNKGCDSNEKFEDKVQLRACGFVLEVLGSADDWVPDGCLIGNIPQPSKIERKD